MITRRHFLRNLCIGVAGFIATKRIALTNDSRQLLAANDEVLLDRPAIVREVFNHRFYNPFSPTGYNMAVAPVLPYVNGDFDRTSSYTLAYLATTKTNETRNG